MFAWLRRFLLPDTAAAGAGGVSDGGSVHAATGQRGAAVAMEAEHGVAPAAPEDLPCREELNERYCRWLLAVEDDRHRKPGRLELDILAALAEVAAARPADLVPRMPGVIPHVLRRIRAGNFSAGDLARDIAQDVVLVAELMRLVNSSLYRPASPVASIEHAILVLGEAGLRQLVTCMAFRPIIDVRSGYFVRLAASRLWDQSEQCAAANRLLSGRFRVDPFHGFLAGLAQNAGLMVALRLLDDVAQGRPVAGSDFFLRRLAMHSLDLSRSIAREWAFPAAIAVAIGEQRPLWDDGCRPPAMPATPLGRMLTVGDYLAKLLMLARAERAADAGRLLDELPDFARACYEELATLASA